MDNSLSLAKWLFSLTVLLFSLNGYSVCHFAVGGPNTQPSAIGKLASALQTSFTKNKNFNLSAFSVIHLQQALSLDADYLVYIKGNSNRVEISVRDILLNEVIHNATYNSAVGLDGALKIIVSDFNSSVLKLLPSYCQKNKLKLE